MIKKFIEGLKSLPNSVLILHFFAKLILGIGIGVLFFAYLKDFGLWIIFLALLMSIPGAFLSISKL